MGCRAWFCRICSAPSERPVRGSNCKARAFNRLVVATTDVLATGEDFERHRYLTGANLYRHLHLSRTRAPIGEARSDDVWAGEHVADRSALAGQQPKH